MGGAQVLKESYSGISCHDNCHWREPQTLNLKARWEVVGGKQQKSRKHTCSHLWGRPAAGAEPLMPKEAPGQQGRTEGLGDAVASFNQPADHHSVSLTW